MRSDFDCCGGLSAVCLLSAVLALGTAYAQPVNDDCAGALPVGEGTFPFDTTGALDDGAGCYGGPPYNEVWYAYTPTVTGDVIIETVDINDDTVIGVHGDCLRTTTLGCNDDCGTRASGVIIPVTAGVTLYIELGGYHASAQTGSLVITPALVGTGPARVWSGEDITFTKPDGVDWTLPEYQDQVTPGVALTRGAYYPLFNIERESAFGQWCTRPSPSGTLWARGRAVDWGSLVFRDLVSLAGTYDLSTMIDQDLVMHVIEENLYIDIRFTSWTSDNDALGGFSYERAIELVNDTCAEATPVVEGATPFVTTRGTDSAPGCYGAWPSVDTWFAYTPAVDGAVFIETVNYGTVDTFLGVYDDCSLATTVACNAGCADGTGRVEFAGLGGKTYYVEVGSYAGGAAGSGQMEITLEPHGAPMVWSGEDMTFTKPDYADWTLPEYQDAITASVTLARRSRQPLFNAARESAWEGYCHPSGTRWALGCAADWQELEFLPFVELSGADPGSLVDQDLVLQILDENIYMDLRFTSWTAGGGGGVGEGGGYSYTRATGVVNEVCENANPIGAGIHALDTTDATSDGIGCGDPEPRKELWYTFTPPTDGSLTIETDAVSGDGSIGVYSDCSQTVVICSADCIDMDARVQFHGESGVTYLIEVGGGGATDDPVIGDLVVEFVPHGLPAVWSGEDMTFTKGNFVEWTLPENQDAIAPSVVLTRGDRRPLINVVRETQWATTCQPTGTQWALGRAVDWVSLEFASFISTARGDPGSLVGQDMVLHVIEENLYIDIRFTSWTPGEGGGVPGGGGFGYERAVGLPNDVCADAIAVGEGTYAFDTAGAGDDGLGCYSVQPYHELWYSYTPSANGAVTIETLNIEGDTYLGVYGDCDRTEPVGCNDDCDGLASRVVFPGIAGTTYYIEVGRYSAGGTASGDLAIGMVPHGPPIVWSGEYVAFMKDDFADFTLPEHQDNITPSVALTRGDMSYLLNAVGELESPNQCSPSGTRWALGHAADWETLEFNSLNRVTYPPAALGDPVVLHILAENIYLDLRFTSWTEDTYPDPAGGGFAYERTGCTCEYGGAADVVDVTDLLLFLDPWFVDDPAADINGGGVSVTDLLDFLDCWLPASGGEACLF